MTAFHDLSLLRAFVGIVESGSISAGARRLKIPQPTLSRYLRQLEENSGAALLRRDTHRMCLIPSNKDRFDSIRRRNGRPCQLRLRAYMSNQMNLTPTHAP